MNKYIILSLGSNIEPRKEYLLLALKELEKYLKIEKVSKIYETKPVGFEKQNNFLNLIVIGDTELTPQELLKKIKETETKVGRKERFRWGPREIDIDIVYFKNKVVEEENLIIPHPERLKRNFVIIPLLELIPDFVDPQTKRPIKEFIQPDQEVHPY
jgi:2-amino-4-hydroxy-6-hydroxymethyldihydropteridine diphosphokinase